MSIEVGSRLKEIRRKLKMIRQQWGEKLGIKLEHRHLIEKSWKKIPGLPPIRCLQVGHRKG